MERDMSLPFKTSLAVLCFLSAAFTGESPPWATRDLRAGIIGTDTSHVPAFTEIFEQNPRWRVKVVAAFKGGSPDLPVSADRVEKFARTIREKNGVKIVATIGELLKLVDVVLIESVDGRPHLEQARAVLKAGKPLFIDKPFAASLADAREIVRLSRETKTPFFSCSCSRFMSEVRRFRAGAGVGKVLRVQGSSHLNILKYHPDLYFYGIHGVEALYGVLGPGCVSVTRKVEGDLDITTGTWKDGRIGIYRGVKKGDYKPYIKIWGTGGEVQTTGGFGYRGLVEVMAEFFHTKKPPIDPAETLELFEFMTAAQLSRERGGAPVKLEELRR